jgi:predicted GNAT family acetyltransferase
MQIEIRHDPDASRFHSPIHDPNPDGDGGPVEMANMGMVLSYREISPKLIDLRSTLVPAHLRGRGLGSQMVRHALDWARENEIQVVPSCPFVARFIEDHPEYQDLVHQDA